MKKLFLSAACLVALSIPAVAAPAPWEADTRPLMFPAAPSAEALANHKFYVRNLIAAGFKADDTSGTYVVDTRPLMFPDHSKVGRTAHYKGAPAELRDPSAVY